MSKNRTQPEAANDTISADEIAALKAQAQADIDAKIEAERAVAIAKGTDTPVDAPRFPVNPNSIRQTIMTALLAGQTTKQIAAVLTEKFPNSAAARKSVIHIAFYRSKMRKAGLLAPRATS